jgi:PAS domain S-box-containing protein
MDSFRKDTGNFLTAILNGTDYGIIATDEAGIIKSFNTGAEKMLGYSSVELVDKESVLVLHDAQEIILRTEKLSALRNEPVAAGFQAIIANAGKPHSDEDEWIYVTKNKVKIPVQMSVSCIRDAEGNIKGYVEIAQDITRRKKHDATLIRYMDYLEELERISKLGGWEIDVVNKSVFWTKEVYHIHEKPYEFVPDYESAISFYDKESLPMVWKALVECMRNGTPFEVHPCIISASGNKKFIRAKGEAVYENGIIAKVVGIFQDITKERVAENMLKEYALDLEKKNRELDQFAYVVSHDLKAPLRGIHNLSEWIEEDIADKMLPDTKRNFELLRKRVNRMENLINGILEYSKAGRSNSEPAYFSAYELINEVTSALTMGKNIAVNLIQPMPFLKTDKIKLEQVISNLVSNAVKYNDAEHPEITITARETEKEYSFCVADNGPGIDPAYHQKIFVIFQTLQNRDSFENTGVGLAIVKKIVEENGGTVWVDTADRKGAKFCFTWLK